MTEQSTVFRSLIFKKLSARDIAFELEGVYGHEALSRSAVKKWCKRFINGRIALKDDVRPGRPPKRDLCESLRVLTDEAPFISCKRM
jgi:transposase